MSGREAVLGAVRVALGRSGSATVAAEPVVRGYRRSGDVAAGSPAALERLTDRLLDYRASVVRCSQAELVGVLVEQLMGAGSVVLPAGVPPEWAPAMADAGVAVTVDGAPEPVTPDALDRTAAVVTGCRVAVAETGTIVLDAGPGQGRRVLTLLANRHVCVVRADQVVASVPEAVTVLAQHPERPQTWISGPSATSDIELVRVEGVHGPRDLRVVLVAARADPRAARLTPRRASAGRRRGRAAP